MRELIDRARQGDRGAFKRLAGAVATRRDASHDGRSVWSADGSRLLAVTGDGGLWEVAVDGSQQRPGTCQVR